MPKVTTSVIILAIALFAGYLYLDGGDDYVDVGFGKEATTTKQASRDVPEGFKEYRNDLYGFSLIHPNTITVKEFDEGGGAKTLVFEDKINTVGFQIFVVPYAERQVSQERFLMDVPSGVRESPKDFKVAGELATSFYSKNATYGETYEIWFIRNGFLFEVSTLKPWENYLLGVAQGWMFLN